MVKGWKSLRSLESKMWRSRKYVEISIEIRNISSVIYANTGSSRGASKRHSDQRVPFLEHVALAQPETWCEHSWCYIGAGTVHAYMFHENLYGDLRRRILSVNFQQKCIPLTKSVSVCLCVCRAPTRFYWLEARQRYDGIGSTTVSKPSQIQRNLKRLWNYACAHMDEQIVYFLIFMEYHH